ncbi:MAG: hypothetical protein AAGM33_06980, partial [Pseudomonadota bacterium]
IHKYPVWRGKSAHLGWFKEFGEVGHAGLDHSFWESAGRECDRCFANTPIVFSLHCQQNDQRGEPMLMLRR